MAFRDTTRSTEDLVAALRDRLACEKGIVFALLFGSTAHGRRTALSDIDVGVYLDPSSNERARWQLRLRIAGELSDLGQIDLVVLNEAPPLLGHRALMGRLLFAHDRAAYVSYAICTISKSEDERPMRLLHARARLRRLEEGAFGRP